MKRWSVMPERYTSLRPRVTYVPTYTVPMTAPASAAQVAMMQDRQRLMSQADQLAQSVGQADVKAQKAYMKAQNAYSLAASAESINLESRGLMFTILAAILIGILFFMKK